MDQPTRPRQRAHRRDRSRGRATEPGGRTATERAHDLWRQVVADFRPPEVDPGVVEAIDAFVARRTEEGGADPVS